MSEATKQSETLPSILAYLDENPDVAVVYVGMSAWDELSERFKLGSQRRPFTMSHKGRAVRFEHTFYLRREEWFPRKAPPPVQALQAGTSCDPLSAMVPLPRRQAAP